MYLRGRSLPYSCTGTRSSRSTAVRVVLLVQGRVAIFSCRSRSLGTYVREPSGFRTKTLRHVKLHRICLRDEAAFLICFHIEEQTVVNLNASVQPKSTVLY